jgi:N-acetyl-1-D-myo-inositol-2-amino-2-deoxy-alpha-D-glucopyranoside deacetylase
MLGMADARWEGRAPRRYLDSTVEPGHPENPASLVAAELNEVAADIAAVMVDVEPDVVVSYPLDDGSANSDRDRVHEATRTAAEVIGVAFYVIEANAVVGGPSVDSMDAIDRRTEALAAYPSRVRIGDDTTTDSLDGVRPLTAPEHFSRLRPPADSFSDASLISRIAVCLLAVLLGGIIGVLTTVAHEATATVGGVSVPWGAIAGILIAAGYLLGMRLVFETRIVPAFGAIGLFGTGAFLVFASGGGALIMRAEPLGINWAIASIVTVALVLAWPQRGRSRRDRIKPSSAKGPDSP